MKRYNLNGACEGESGRCLEEMVKDVDGDYVQYLDAKDEIDKRDETIADLKALVRTLRKAVVDSLEEGESFSVAKARELLPQIDKALS
jgi:hypothetical protein